MAKGKNTVELVTKLAQPVADEMGLVLWDVRFEKEGASWYLRLFIDKPEGVDILNCESFSHAIDKLLDAADPIEQSYFLEVGSPGIERELVHDWHFKAYMGELVVVRLFRPKDGQKEFVGRLVKYKDDFITVASSDGAEHEFALSETAFVRLYFDFDNMGGLEENE
ncbi:MAG: ribosome maturation factor RimP [Hydrogenoanaerobacterium sp.]